MTNIEPNIAGVRRTRRVGRRAGWWYVGLVVLKVAMDDPLVHQHFGAQNIRVSDINGCSWYLQPGEDQSNVSTRRSQANRDAQFEGSCVASGGVARRSPWVPMQSRNRSNNPKQSQRQRLEDLPAAVITEHCSFGAFFCDPKIDHTCAATCCCAASWPEHLGCDDGCCIEVFLLFFFFMCSQEVLRG